MGSPGDQPPGLLKRPTLCYTLHCPYTALFRVASHVHCTALDVWSAAHGTAGTPRTHAGGSQCQAAPVRHINLSGASRRSRCIPSLLLNTSTASLQGLEPPACLTVIPQACWTLLAQRAARVQHVMSVTGRCEGGPPRVRSTRAPVRGARRAGAQQCARRGGQERTERHTQRGAAGQQLFSSARPPCARAGDGSASQARQAAATAPPRPGARPWTTPQLLRSSSLNS